MRVLNVLFRLFLALTVLGISVTIMVYALPYILMIAGVVIAGFILYAGACALLGKRVV